MASYKVTYPGNGETIRRGEYIKITWEVIDPDGFTYYEVLLQFRKHDDTLIQDIDIVSRDQGFYIFKIPENADIYDYRIKILEDPGGAISFTSGNFSVAEKYSIMDFYRLNSFEKIILAEMKLGKEVDFSGKEISNTFLVHSNTFNGDTTLTDSAAINPSTITGHNGIAHSTTWSKYGSTAIEFIRASNQYMSVPTNIKFTLSNKPKFTLGTWIYFNPAIIGVQEMIFSEFLNINNRFHVVKLTNESFQIVLIIGGVVILSATSSINLVQQNKGYYLTAIRNGADWGIYLDGKQILYDNVETLYNIAGTFYIGTFNGGSNWHDGFMDEINITPTNYFNVIPKADLSSKFKPPIAPFTSGSYVADLSSNEEIIALKENNTLLERTFSIADCDNNSGSFFHDYNNQRLFINLIAADAFYLGYIFKCFTNRQDSDYQISFIPQDASLPVYYKPYLKTDSIPAITQKVGDYYTSAMVTQFGTIIFTNDGWWWEVEYVYEWHNKEITIKIGEKSINYNEFVTIFNGITKNPSFADERISIGVKDARAGFLKSIPVDVMVNDIDNPELDSGDENKPMPLLFGIKSNITCIRFDDKEYRIGGLITDPEGNVIGYESIDSVYVDGIQQYITSDYTVNATNNEITFINDPNDGLVTADVQGLKCQIDFSDGTYDDIFSENTADILFTILTAQNLNNIPIDKIEIDSFGLFQTKRSQRLGFFIDTLKTTMDIVRSLQASAIFHFIPTLDGRFQVRYYDRSVSDIPSFYNEDYKGFSINKVTDTAFEKVIIKYDRDPSTDQWKQVEGETLETSYKYDKTDVLPIETLLINQTEAESLIVFYNGIVKDPSAKLVTEIPPEGLELIPSDKRKFNRSVISGAGDKIQILEDEIYLILEVQKNINSGRVNIVAIKDNQATGGYTDHTDGVHTDEHTDGIHSDIPHGDSHTDEHTDVHTDTAHTDEHSDVGYEDEHEDIPHTDTYQDILYQDHGDEHTDFHDIDHSDGPYTDEHGDTHEDHVDDTHSYTDVHGDISHDDFHQDESYIDTHGDGYTDEYTDEHSDVHDDVPHTDSEI